MRVLKFGGTSVQDSSAIERLIRITMEAPGTKVVVVSALSKITDTLVTVIASILKGPDFQIEILQRLEALKERHLQCAKELGVAQEFKPELDEHIEQLLKLLDALYVLGDVPARASDFILGLGERLSSRLIFLAFQKKVQAPLSYIDPTHLIVTDSNFGSAQILWQPTFKKVAALFSSVDETLSGILVTGGFVGATEDGAPTTLGRGGSDLTASILAACLKAEVLEFWKDVDGILTTDPRIVPQARLVNEVTYGEAAELCFFGAKILHPSTILPAVEHQIPIEIWNSTKGRKACGTRIVSSSATIPNKNHVIKSISLKSTVTALSLHSNRMLGAAGFLSKVFHVFAEQNVSVDLISTSEVNLSLTLERPLGSDALDALVTDLKHFAHVEVHTQKAVLSCVGEGIKETPGVAARVFQALAGFNIHMISQGASELNLSLVLDNSHAAEALKKLHSDFFETNS